MSLGCQALFITGLLYGVECTSPIEVPIPKRQNGMGWDYSVWVSFNDNTSIQTHAFCAIHQNQPQQDALIIHLDQSSVPEWYENHLLSSSTHKWMGNVLLVMLNDNWPTNLTIPPKDIIASLSNPNRSLI